MAVDLTGGIDPSRELMFASAPENPEMRDSASFWIFDEGGEVGLPRIGIEAVASSWDSHAVQVNVAFGDGRVFRLRTDGKAWPAAGPDGRPTVLGAGPLAFTCVRPFQDWTISFDGQAVQTTSADLVAARPDGPLVDLAFHVEATMAVPPWVQGAMQADAAASLESSIVGDMMGGPRYEQLFRATGSLRVGAVEHTFTGSGLRIRRQGVRKLEGFWGHCWQSALFGSGKAFGYIAYPPRPDGEPAYNEGYLFDPGRGDALIPARVVEAPWLSQLQPLGEAVPVVFETRDGIERIDGVTVLSTHHIISEADKANMSEAEEAAMTANWSFPPLQQCGVRYTWDGEQSHRHAGAIEHAGQDDGLAAFRTCSTATAAGPASGSPTCIPVHSESDGGVEQRLLDHAVAGLEGDHAGDPPPVVPVGRLHHPELCGAVSVDIHVDRVRRQRLFIGAPDERLDGHLVIAGVVMAAQAVLLLGRGEAQSQAVGHADRDVGARVERFGIGQVDHRS